MKNSENDIYLIEKYLEGSLEISEENAFLERLKSEPDFAKLYEQRKKLQTAYVASARRIHIKKKIQNAIFLEKKRGTAQRYYWYAAAILSFITIGSILLYTNKPINNTEAYSLEGSDTLSIIHGEKRTPENYANLETVKPVYEITDFSPHEESTILSSDSIDFIWPGNIQTDYLTIYNSKGVLVKKVKIKSKTKKITLMPGELAPGIYFWKLMNDSSLIRITIK